MSGAVEGLILLAFLVDDDIIGRAWKFLDLVWLAQATSLIDGESQELIVDIQLSSQARAGCHAIMIPLRCLLLLNISHWVAGGLSILANNLTWVEVPPA